ncbi:MAG: hypothetical protein LBT75_02460, partial [Bacilli bacterium]|nr:hypothetical protein [Bacilli bacterium]
MKKNKLTSYLLIFLLCLLWEAFISSNIKAATYQVNNVASLKSTIESASAGTHDVEITDDFDFTGNAITVPANVTINLHSESTRHILSRSSSYLGTFFNITNINSSMNVTNLIIDGQKGIMVSNPNGILFNLGTDNTRTLTLGKDLIVRNHKTTGNGLFVYNNGSILNLKDNVEFYSNEQLSSGALIYASNASSITNISDNVLLYDNNLISSGGSILTNYGTVYISDNVKIYNNGSTTTGGSLLYNYNSGNITFNNNVEFYNNMSSSIPIMNRGQMYAKENVKFHDNTGFYGLFALNSNDTGGTLLNSLDLSDNVEIYNNNADVAGAIIIGQSSSATTFTPHELHISGNVQIYNNKADIAGGAVYIQGPSTDVLIEGTTKIFNNQSESHSGAVYSTTGSRVVIKDEVTIFSNIAKTYGGGIVTTASNGSLILDGNVKIYDNRAPSGGGLYLSGNNTIGGNTEIYNNEAIGDTSNVNNHGGGIYLNNVANKTIIKDNVQIYDNKTTNANTPNNDGGGIYINASVVTPVQILDKVSITNNEAVRDGGGIFTQEYEDLIVSKDVLFNNNKAIVGYNENLPVIDPTNYAIYQTNVLVPNNKW